MILIADSGSTKTDWCLLQKDGTEISFTTEGYNPEYMTPEYILSSLKKQLPEDYKTCPVKKIFFYGAGCYDDKFPVIRNPLKEIFGKAEIHVAMDLIAAARALLGDSKGFAAILGTGTNSCIYNGKEVVQNIDSLGFILGDEGSGAYLGKKLLSDYMRGYMPEEVRKQFYARFNLSIDDIIDRVYTRPMPNRFCAGFSTYIKEKEQEHPYYRQLVRDSFKDLFTNIIRGYDNYRAYAFNCTGSVAWFFRESLEETVTGFGMEMGKVLRYPMDGLKIYHRNHL